MQKSIFASVFFTKWKSLPVPENEVEKYTVIWFASVLRIELKSLRDGDEGAQVRR
jgi:hypothetical protein